MLERLIEVRTLSHSMGQSVQLTSMMFSGVFDAFPKLRVAYCEAGSGWGPFMADRLGMEVGSRRGQAPELKCLPSEHLPGGRHFIPSQVDQGGRAAAVVQHGR